MPPPGDHKPSLSASFRSFLGVADADPTQDYILISSDNPQDPSFSSTPDPSFRNGSRKVVLLLVTAFVVGLAVPRSYRARTAGLGRFELEGPPDGMSDPGVPRGSARGTK
jgi:hypothetical protein